MSRGVSARSLAVAGSFRKGRHALVPRRKLGSTKWTTHGDSTFCGSTGDTFILGVIGTLTLTGLSMLFGLILGIPVGIGRLSKSRLVRFLSGAFIEVFRDTPILVQLVWVFYCLPILTGIQMSAFASATLAMAVHATRISRRSLPRRHCLDRPGPGRGRASPRPFGVADDSAASCFRKRIQRVIPPMLNVFADFMKASALASVIGVWELFPRGEQRHHHHLPAARGVHRDGRHLLPDHLPLRVGPRRASRHTWRKEGRPEDGDAGLHICPRRSRCAPEQGETFMNPQNPEGTVQIKDLHKVLCRERGAERNRL